MSNDKITNVLFPSVTPKKNEAWQGFALRPNAAVTDDHRSGGLIGRDLWAKTLEICQKIDRPLKRFAVSLSEAGNLEEISDSRPQRSTYSREKRE